MLTLALDNLSNNLLHKQPFDYIDLQMASSTFSTSGKPLKLTSQEFQDFKNSIFLEGVGSGLQPTELSSNTFLDLHYY